MSDDKRIVEINGIKVEVDLRSAKRVDCYRVGDRVKVLIKSYGDSFQSQHGVIVAFDEFTQRPGITVCYIDSDYSPELHFVTINKDSKDVEIAPCGDEIGIEKGEVVARINRKIESLKAEIEDLERKRKYFIDRFGAWFTQEEDNKKEG